MLLTILVASFYSFLFFWLPKRTKRPWHELTRSVAEEWCYLRCGNSPKTVTALRNIVEATSLKQGFVPVWYGCAMVSTEEDYSMILSLPAVVRPADMGNLFIL